MSEIDNIKARYNKRKKMSYKCENYFLTQYIKFERELKYCEILNRNFKNLNDIKLLEIGAGGIIY